MSSNRNSKSQKAKHAVFASQFFKAFQVFCQESNVEPDMKNCELLKSFYHHKITAKSLNSEIKKTDRRARRNAKHHVGSTVRPNAVRYNKGFFLIDGDCLVGQEPIPDKTQVCEPKHIVIQ